MSERKLCWDCHGKQIGWSLCPTCLGAKWIYPDKRDTAKESSE